MEKNKSGVSIISWQSRGNQVQRGGDEVWYALGAEDNIVIRRKVICNDIWDAVANCGALATLPEMSDPQASAPILGRNPSRRP